LCSIEVQMQAEGTDLPRRPGNETIRLGHRWPATAHRRGAGGRHETSPCLLRNGAFTAFPHTFDTREVLGLRAAGAEMGTVSGYWAAEAGLLAKPDRRVAERT
jgi:hypothetical protein